MADTKTTGLTANTAPLLTDIMYLVDDPGGSAASQKITLQNLRRQLFPYGVCGGRLTLTTGVPVTTADVSGGTHVYFTPYSSSFGCGQIGLYDGSAGWDVINFTEYDLNIAAYTASKPYDLFAYNNSGALAIEGLVWTNSTTRATALTTQDGILVKTGATTRRYLGTIYVNSSGGQTDDADARRNVWNYYNRVTKRLFFRESTEHTYGTATWRAWNNSAVNIIQLTIGVCEDAVALSIWTEAKAGNAANPLYVGIGYDAVNAEAEANMRVAISATTIFDIGHSSHNFTAVGNHYYAPIEYVIAGANATLYTVCLRGAVRC